jgi:HEAT repeat protein
VSISKSEMVVSRLASSDWEVAWEAAQILIAANSKKVTRQVLKVLRSAPFLHSKVYSIVVLRLLEDPRALPALLQILDRTTEPELRDEAAEALGTFGRLRSSRALDALVRASRDPDARVRYSVAHSLASFGWSPVARTTLEYLLGDTEVPLGQLASVGSEAQTALEIWK